jgi:hypothetical protein
MRKGGHALGNVQGAVGADRATSRLRARDLPRNPPGKLGMAHAKPPRRRAPVHRRENPSKESVMKTSVYCLAKSDAQADQLVRTLQAAGFNDNDISVLFADQGTSRDFAHEKHTKAPEGAATGAGAGGILGGALGWMIGIGSLAIPGVGPFIAAGPILAALGGVAIGGVVGGITGALVGFGIPEYEAKRYEGKVRNGRVLISVHAEDSKEVTRIEEIFRQGGAEDIASATEAAVTTKH